MRTRRTKPPTPIVKGEVALIELTQGKHATVDVEDLPLVEDKVWCVQRKGSHYYAARAVRKEDGTKTLEFMHQHLTGNSGYDVDHIDGDGLNNTRANLRFADDSQNQANQRPRVGTSKYKGVCWDKKANRWRAKIVVNNVTMNLGMFRTELEAAEAYDRAATHAKGEFAWTNGLVVS